MSTDGSSDGMGLLMALVAVSVISLAVMLGRLWTEHQRENACERRGGVLLHGTESDVCLRKDAIIQGAIP